MALITVSRTHASGGAAFAKKISEKFGYACYGSSSMKLSSLDARDHLNSLCVDGSEERPFFERFEELTNNRNFFKTALMARVYDLALKGDAVFIGMGVQIILSAVPSAIHIRIVRNLPERVKAIAQLKKQSYDDALDLLEKMDRGKREFISHYFDEDVNDPTLYHITFNAGFLPLECAVRMTDIYRAEYITAEKDRETQKILFRKLLEKKAELLLFRLDMGHDYGKINFEALDNNVLAVRGIIGGSDARKKLFDALGGLREVQRIEDHLKVGILSRMLY